MKDVLHNVTAYFPEEWAWIMKINALFILLFLLLTIGLIGFIIFLRVEKNIRNDKKQAQQLLLIDFLNSFLFEEDFDKLKEIEDFRTDHLKTPLEIKVTIKEILLFHENLKGESAIALEELFLQLQLDKFVLNDLKKGNWFTVARAIYALSELGIEVSAKKIEPYLNDPKNEVRQQSQLYFLKVAKDNPLQFLDKTERPLTTWQQIYIENALKNFYQGPAPDFSIWLDHKLDTVVEFSIRMIARYNQFENIPKLLPFLKNEKESIRKEAIHALCSLEYIELLNLILPTFKQESISIKKEILRSVEQLGTFDDLKEIKPMLAAQDWELKIKYFNIEKYFFPNKKDEIHMQYLHEQEMGL
ncbi:hypothetical protein L1I30_13800 [Gillisia sp. M10.2A]|uniref:HEAT repeat domain-containing protein n=1 Tax=Gillisia lutea TaxID=2909668 RepID=A0ABS9EIR3_9FLAO|nr:hypothetical protein [Gillisia lutea]MCF4102747.1 hypothetical protein [Gillisia lutea]